MEAERCQLTIDGQPHAFALEGEFFWGKDEQLFSEASSPIAGTGWQNQGYTCFPLMQGDEYARLLGSIRRILTRIGTGLGVVLPDDFRPEEYHHYFPTEELHQQVIQQTRFLTFRDFDLDFREWCSRVATFVGHPLQLENPLLPEEIVILRISRPNSLDINPLHRDGYLDIWAGVLNLWIPIAGCDAHSSLPVIPGSHLWRENTIRRTAAKGARVNGLTYHVPGIVGAASGLHLIRPDPAYGEALLFTPFLIHGAAINENPDTTRLSLELRFCRS